MSANPTCGQCAQDYCCPLRETQAEVVRLRALTAAGEQVRAEYAQLHRRTEHLQRELELARKEIEVVREQRDFWRMQWHRGVWATTEPFIKPTGQP